MEKRLFITATAVAAALALTACSGSPKPGAVETKAEVAKPAEPPKPPEPVAAQTAFYEMYKPARSWATDLLPLSLASNELPTLRSEGGKYARWTAVFVSPSRREARTFFYSAVSDGESVTKGVTAGGAQPWSGETPKSRPFQTTAFVVNSDAAYKAALTKAEAWVKQHPDKTASMFLGSSAKYPSPVWFIIWGTTKSGYAVYVDATTGIVNPK